MAVITLKDGTVVTMFESIEAIDLVGKELYDFILTANRYDSLLANEREYELEVVIDDLESELAASDEYIQELENEIDDIKEELKNHLRQINTYQDTIKRILGEEE